MRKKIFLAFSLLVFAAPLFAQEGYEHFSAIAHGAGRTYVVSSFGLDAVGLNPALLYAETQKKFEIRVFPITGAGVDAGSGFRNVNSLVNIFDITKGDINDDELDSVANNLKANKLSGRGDAEVLGVAYHWDGLGTFAFTWTAHAALRTDIPGDFLEFLSSAKFNLASTEGTYNDLDLQGLWYNEYSLSFAKKAIDNSSTNSFLQSLQLGGSLKYVAGVGIIQVQQGNYFNHRAIGGGANVEMNYQVLSAYSTDFDPKKAPTHFSFDFLGPAPGGSGLGVDLGVSASVLVGGKVKAPALLFGASVTDIGFISWSENAATRNGFHLRDSVNWVDGKRGLTDTLKRFSGELRDSAFSTPLPTMLRLGALLDLGAFGKSWGGFTPRFAMEFAAGLSYTVGSLKHPRFGAGITLSKAGEKASLRLAGGFVLEKDAPDITLGAGTTLFDIVSIDAATAHLLEIFKSEKRLDIALSIKATF